MCEIHAAIFRFDGVSLGPAIHGIPGVCFLKNFFKNISVHLLKKLSVIHLETKSSTFSLGFELAIISSKFISEPFGSFYGWFFTNHF